MVTDDSMSLRIDLFTMYNIYVMSFTGEGEIEKAKLAQEI